MTNQSPLIVANWKMNGLLCESMQFFKDLRSRLKKNPIKSQVVICPPFTLLRDLADKVPGTSVKLGGQNCHHDDKGAHTGDISASMLKDMTCDYVIIGHSERRSSHNESSELVRKKSAAAHQVGLNAIICIGETQFERDNDLTKIVLREQLLNSLPPSANDKNTVIAYEPVWAIGSNKIPTIEEIEQAHQHIEQALKNEVQSFGKNVRIIYGGSVSLDNANTILSNKNVAGLLIGRASLALDEFWSIIDEANNR